ncbi:MAG TPA: NAD-dependent protein deacylase [Ruminococcaceae bacterium]|nr:NAD-dependent protein deacylase [Oscillospiraceae bacterium]
MDKEKLKQFAEMINRSGKTVFFGGAGVSTESGVKDYRSEDGLYNTVREYGVSPETILSHSFFVSKPDVFYDFYYKYFLEINVEPNTAHLVLAVMEKKGKLSSVLTQNIDGLHQKAGSKNVLELHGTTAVHYCMECGKPYPLEKLKALKGKVPYCEKCGGLVRPEVVLYEEPLNESVVEKAISEISTAELLIIGGTSLAVYPAAMYIRYFRGSHIVLINKGQTDFDSNADLVFHDSIGQVLGGVADKI